MLGATQTDLIQGFSNSTLNRTIPFLFSKFSSMMVQAGKGKSSSRKYKNFFQWLLDISGIYRLELTPGKILGPPKIGPISELNLLRIEPPQRLEPPQSRNT